MGGQINSLRFSNSGKMVCAVSNDGSVNAWVYPLELRVVEPELTTTTGQLQGKEAEGDGEERDGVKSRAATPREGTPDEEGERGKGEEDREGETVQAEAHGEDTATTADGNGNEGMQGDGADGKPEGDVEMVEANGKVEGGSKEVVMTEMELKQSTAPSRQSTPPPTTTPTRQPQPDIDARRSKQLRRFRHNVCHSASLLSLSFDPLGR